MKIDSVKIIEIGAVSQPLLDAWQEKARLDQSIYPFMSFSPRWSRKSAEGGDDWDTLYLMDESGTGLLQFAPDRIKLNHEATICLWVLDGPRKKLVAAALFKQILPLCRRYGVKYVDAACHESNADSLRVLSKRFGKPTGYDVEHGWNALKGRFEGVYNFRSCVWDW